MADKPFFEKTNQAPVLHKTLQNPVQAPGSKALEHGTVYTRTPTLDQWKKDSSVALARRADDQTLTRIDEILAAYHAGVDDFVRYQLKADLFFTLDYWLKTYKSGAGMNKGREPAVYGLYKYTVESLCVFFRCAVNALPEQLELHFGRRMSYHGEKRDQVENYATYLQRSQARKYRLTFRNGLAYMFTWPGKGTEHSGGEAVKVPEGKLKLVLAESTTAANPAVFRKSANWGGFALSMGRDLYMARHHCGAAPGSGGNFYHSSYLGGDPVLCAGTMKIHQGVVTAIANDSGHYAPSSEHFIGMLHALRMFGVNLAALDVHQYQPDSGDYLLMKGDVFLTHHGNWVRALHYGQATVKSSNDVTRQHFLTDRREDEALILRLWQQGVASGVVLNNDSGREYFASTLLKNYVSRHGAKPMETWVDAPWILAALDRAIGRLPKLPAGQMHGKLPF